MSLFNEPNSAFSAMQQQINQQHRDFQQQVFQQQENFKHRQAIDTLSQKLNNQNITQTEMNKTISKIVNTQNESNKIMQAQCEELRKQNELLQMQNESQAKELKKQKIWNWITYGITTAIAIASVIGTFIELFK